NCAERFAGRLEGRARTSARLVEEADDRLAAQRGHARHVAAEDFLHGIGRLHDGLEFRRCEVVYVEEVAAGPGARRFGHRGCRCWSQLFLCHTSPSLRMILTSSRPSVSSSRTWTLSCIAVGMFFPT